MGSLLITPWKHFSFLFLKPSFWWVSASQENGIILSQKGKGPFLLTFTEAVHTQCENRHVRAELVRTRTFSTLVLLWFRKLRVAHAGGKRFLQCSKRRFSLIHENPHWLQTIRQLAAKHEFSICRSLIHFDINSECNCEMFIFQRFGLFQPKENIPNAVTLFHKERTRVPILDASEVNSSPVQQLASTTWKRLFIWIVSLLFVCLTMEVSMWLSVSWIRLICNQSSAAEKLKCLIDTKQPLLQTIEVAWDSQLLSNFWNIFHSFMKWNLATDYQMTSWGWLSSTQSAANWWICAYREFRGLLCAYVQVCVHLSIGVVACVYVKKMRSLSQTSLVLVAVSWLQTTNPCSPAAWTRELGLPLQNLSGAQRSRWQTLHLSVEERPRVEKMLLTRLSPQLWKVDVTQDLLCPMSCRRWTEGVCWCKQMSKLCSSCRHLSQCRALGDHNQCHAASTTPWCIALLTSSCVKNYALFKRQNWPFTGKRILTLHGTTTHLLIHSLNTLELGAYRVRNATGQPSKNHAGMCAQTGFSKGTQRQLACGRPVGVCNPCCEPHPSWWGDNCPFLCVDEHANSLFGKSRRLASTEQSCICEDKHTVLQVLGT